MSGERVITQIEHRRVEIGARVAALVLVVTLTALTPTEESALRSLLLLACLAVAASLPVRTPSLRRWRPIAEAAVASALIATTGVYEPALLPYLVVPALSAGLATGWAGAVTAAGISALVLLTRGFHDPIAGTEYLADVAQWTLLALAVGLLAAWLRRVQTQRPSDAESYAEASRLLAQLRDLSRQLSGGLDAVSIGHSLLQELPQAAAFDRGALFVQSPGGLLVLLAAEPPGWVEWEPNLESGPWAEAWRGEEPYRSDHGFAADPSQCSVVLPVRLGDDVVGLVGLERRGQTFSAQEVFQAQLVLDEGVVRLDAALLFDDVRTFATAEERRRLAREIHDGIAQELASLGYVIDDLTARADRSQEDLAQGLRQLRGELSRVISELRMSIFDLRSQVGPGLSLTAALAEHARAVGATSGLTINLELAETPARLRIETETELLRIAQEAISNARKHAGARTLWIQCRVDPPNAVLVVEDDGRGLVAGRSDSFGLDIMEERAARIGGVLTIGQRTGGGARVEVRTGPGARGEGDRAYQGAAGR